MRAATEVAAGGRPARAPGALRRADRRDRSATGATGSSARSLFSPLRDGHARGPFDEALAEANAPVYGLTAGVFTEDPAEKERLAEIEAGVVT